MNPIARRKLLKKSQATTADQKNPELLVDVTHILKDTTTYKELKQEALRGLAESRRTKTRAAVLLKKHLISIAVTLFMLIPISYYSDTYLQSLNVVSITIMLISITALGFMVFSLMQLLISGLLFTLLPHWQSVNPSQPQQDRIDAVASENIKALHALFIDFFLKNNHIAITKKENANIESEIKTGNDDYVARNQIRILGGYEVLEGDEGVAMLFLTLTFNDDYTKLSITDYLFALA